MNNFKILAKGYSLVEVLVAAGLLSGAALIALNTTDLMQDTKTTVQVARVEALALNDFFKIMETPTICSYTLKTAASNYPNSGTNLLPILIHSGSGTTEKLYDPGTDSAILGSFGKKLEIKSFLLKKYHPHAGPPPVLAPGEEDLRLAGFELTYQKDGRDHTVNYDLLVYTLITGGQEVISRCWAGADYNAYLCESVLGGIWTAFGCNGMRFDNIQLGSNTPYFGGLTEPSAITQTRDRGSVYLMDKLKIGSGGTAPAEVTIDGMTGTLLTDAIQVNGSITSLATTKANKYQYISDKKFKEDISDFKANDAKNILKLQSIGYNLKLDPSGKSHFGLSAQEIQKYFPSAVTKKHGNLMVDYGKLIAPLVKQIQEQEKLILNYEKRLLKLKKNKKI